MKKLKDMMIAERKKRFDQSNQLTLGELILKLEPIVIKSQEEEVAPNVQFDFEYLIPTTFDSWRGSYEELALGFVCTGYDGDPSAKNINVIDFYAHCRNTIGKEFTGWKGGDFVMNKNTPVWVANPGNSGNTAIVDVLDDDWRVILITAHTEF